MSIFRAARRFHPSDFSKADAAEQSRVAAGIKISMDGRGHWMDNVFIERLWRS